MMDGVRMKDQIQFAHVLEALVQRFDKHLYQIQNAQLALRRVDAEDKVQRGIVPIDELVVGAADQRATLQEIAHIVVALRHQLECLFDYLLLVVLVLGARARSVRRRCLWTNHKTDKNYASFGALRSVHSHATPVKAAIIMAQLHGTHIMLIEFR